MKVLLPIHLDRFRSPIGDLLRSCVRYNPDIDFFSFSAPETLEDARLGRELWRLPNLKIVSVPDLFRLKFDIVHTASINQRNMCASLLSKLRGASSTLTLNSLNLEIKVSDRPSWRRFHQGLCIFDYWTAVSRTVASIFAKKVSSRFLGVIPNGFDPAFFDRVAAKSSDDIDSRCLAATEHPYALFVSALEPRKRPDFVAQIARMVPNLRIVGVGFERGGVSKPYLEAFSKISNFSWLGSVDRSTVRFLMLHANVLVFPSDTEGLPLSVIEALGMGIPVIAQPKSSLPEIISDSKNGRLIDCADIGEWIDAIHHFSNLPAEDKLALSQAIREDAIERFSWNNISAEYGKVYQQLKHIRENS